MPRGHQLRVGVEGQFGLARRGASAARRGRCRPWRRARSSAPSVGSPSTLPGGVLGIRAAAARRRCTARRRAAASAAPHRRRSARHPLRAARLRARSRCRSTAISRPPRQPQRGHRHLVARQRAGLVAADGGGRAQRLHRRQPADDGAAPGHALHAHGQRDGHGHRQPLGHHRHHLADGHHQHLGQRQPAPQAEQHHHHEQAQRRTDQPAPELLDAPLQRRRRLDRGGGQPGDVADLGVHAGGHDQGARAAGADEGAGIDHASAVGQAGVLGQRRQGLGHGHRFAGERGLGHLQLRELDQPRVGRRRRRPRPAAGCRPAPVRAPRSSPPGRRAARATAVPTADAARPSNVRRGLPARCR